LDYDAVTCRLERRLELAAADFAELFHAWLAELIYLLDAERLAFARFDCTFGPDGRTLVATAAGEEVDAARHHPHGEVKNVTYAEYAVHASAEGYTARVIFDL
jgi:SHS2 domain-containing protein